MVMRIKYDDVCEVLIALFLADNLPWIGDRYGYYFIDYLTSYSHLGISFKGVEEGDYKEGFGNTVLDATRCISKYASREHR